MKTPALIVALLLFSVSAVFAGEPGKDLPVVTDSRQELDRTMQWLKSTIESITITLIPMEPENVMQYYSRYSFDNEGCSVKCSYDFTYYQKLTKSWKTTRIVATFNLKDIGVPEVAPFYLTHIETQLYSVYGNTYRIPVKNSEVAEQIAKNLDQARRLCGATR